MQVRRVVLAFKSRRQTVETGWLPISRARESSTSSLRARRCDRHRRSLLLQLQLTSIPEIRRQPRQNFSSSSRLLNPPGSADCRRCLLTRARIRSIIPARNASASKKPQLLSWLNSSKTKRSVRWIRAASPAITARCAARADSDRSARVLRAGPRHPCREGEQDAREPQQDACAPN